MGNLIQKDKKTILSGMWQERLVVTAKLCLRFGANINEMGWLKNKTSNQPQNAPKCP